MQSKRDVGVKVGTLSTPSCSGNIADEKRRIEDEDECVYGICVRAGGERVSRAWGAHKVAQRRGGCAAVEARAEKSKRERGRRRQRKAQVYKNLVMGMW